MNTELLQKPKTQPSQSEAVEKKIIDGLNQPKADLEVKPVATTQQKVMMLTAVILPLLGVVAAIILLWQVGFVGWTYVAMLFFGWLFTTLGITIGFHRLCSHKSFDTYRWVRMAWMALGTMSVEGAPLTWCAVHRRHHSHSDREGDPHSPHLAGTGFWGMVKGLFHGQIGWLFTGYWSQPNYEKWIPDLVKDKMLVSINNNYYWLVIASLGIPTLIGYFVEGSWFGALLGFIWGGLVRVFVTHHITWSINSICHVFGRRDYKSSDHSTNNVVCGILAAGEGWHNNHHAFPSSARHGLKWWQFDLSWIIIRLMSICGLAWNIKLPSQRALAAKRIDR